MNKYFQKWQRQYQGKTQTMIIEDKESKAKFLELKGFKRVGGVYKGARVND